MNKSEKWEKLLLEINQTYKDKHQVISTEIKGLDYILGGGLELGSKVQIVAESSTGKSTIALQMAKNFCQKNLNVLYVDTENSITKELLESTGCNEYLNEGKKDGMLVLLKESDFDTVNEKLDVLIKSGVFKLIIIDSLASMVSNNYVETKDGKEKIIPLTNNNTNYESRPLNLFINKYSNLANKYNVAIIYINQFRNKVDPKNGTILKEFGNKIVRYNSDIIIRIKKEKDGIWQDENGIISTDKEFNRNKLPTHSKLIMTLDKSNKMLCGTTTDGYLKYGYGIDELFDRTLDRIRNNEIQKNGKYYSLPNESTNFNGLIDLINHIVSSSKTSTLSPDNIMKLEGGYLHLDFVDDEDEGLYDENGKLDVEFISEDEE